jgi:hypothetical protein
VNADDTVVRAPGQGGPCFCLYGPASLHDGHCCFAGPNVTRTYACPTHDAEIDAYLVQEREAAYHAVADELGDSRTSLDDLDPVVIIQARQHAEAHDLTWPPPGIDTGWLVTITSTI